MPDTTTALHFALALSPIVVVLVLMIGFRWGGAEAGSAGWLVALAGSVLFFGAGAGLLAYSQMRALLLTLYVLYIVWMALLLYNVAVEAGAIATIGAGIVRLTEDRALQLLLLAWVFSSFLQGIAGYGVPIAVVVPLFIGLGFSPVLSVTAVAVGHAWSVNFGSIAASFNALIAASGLPGEVLAPASALLLGLTCFLCGIAVLLLHDGLRGLRHGAPAILIIGAAMAGTQYLLAASGLWNIAAFGAGAVGLAVTALVGRLPIHRRAASPSEPDGTAAGPVSRGGLPLPLAVAPYAFLVVFVTVAELAPWAHAVLNRIKIQVTFPATETALGWVNQAGKGQAISVFGHAGALLVYASLAGFLLYLATGHSRPGAAVRILSNTARSAVRSSIGIATMVGFALIMEQSGMTNAIAVGLSLGLAPVYPFVAPFVGLLGAFMTGSNTNSNVIFAGLQQQTAQLLGLSAPLILALQTTGGSIGGMLAPARIILGCSTAGLVGQEGQVLRRTIVYGLVICVIIGTIGLLMGR